MDFLEDRQIGMQHKNSDHNNVTLIDRQELLTVLSTFLWKICRKIEYSYTKIMIDIFNPSLNQQIALAII